MHVSQMRTILRPETLGACPKSPREPAVRESSCVSAELLGELLQLSAHPALMRVQPAAGTRGSQHVPGEPFGAGAGSPGPPRLSAAPLLGTRSPKTLLLFLSVGSGWPLLPPCLCCEPAGGTFLSLHHCLLCDGDHRLVLQSELGIGQGLLLTVLGKTHFCLGCQRENDFIATQHCGSSFCVLPSSISLQATVTWIIIIEYPHGQ